MEVLLRKNQNFLLMPGKNEKKPNPNPKGKGVQIEKKAQQIPESRKEIVEPEPNPPEVKPKFLKRVGRYLKSRIGSIIVLLISWIFTGLAFSEDSYFFKLWPPDTYSVIRVVTAGGRPSTGFYRPFQGITDTLLTPIHLMLFLNIRNESNHDQTLNGVLLEADDGKGGWKSLRCMELENGVFWRRESSRIFDSLSLGGKIFLENVRRPRMKPDDVTAGWLFLEFPQEFWERDMEDIPLRLTLFSGFGERETHEIKPVDTVKDPNFALLHKASFGKFTIQKDLSKLKKSRDLTPEEMFNLHPH